MKALSSTREEIYLGGFPILLRKCNTFLQFLLNKVFLILNAPWVIPVIVLTSLIRPWYLIRFGTFRNERIGHFTADAGHHYARRAVSSSHGIDFYWLPKGQSSNLFFDKLVRRNFIVSPWVYYVYQWNSRLPLSAPHCLPSSTTGSRDVEGVLEKSPEMLPFLPTEDLAAQEWLKKQGWKQGEPYICLLVRDSSYLATDPLHNKTNWEYHNYRDSDIATYVEASEWLANQGVWVLRMGKVMAKPIPTNHPRVIDYAFHPDKSDFLDIWLFAHCNLCISTSSGPDMVSDIYRRPLLFINCLSPLSNLVSWSNAIQVPKHLVWKETGRYLTLVEHLQNSWSYTKQYEQAGIEIINLSSHEILLAVQEAWLTIEGKWVESDYNTQRQERFWEIFRSHPNFHQHHGWVHPKCRLGDNWLKQMGDDFLS